MAHGLAFSSLAIARSSKCDKISGLLLFGSRKQAGTCLTGCANFAICAVRLVPAYGTQTKILGVKDRRIHGSRTRILVARCARSSNARASHFSSLAIARSSKCDYFRTVQCVLSLQQWLADSQCSSLR